MDNEPDKWEVQRWVIPYEWNPQIVRTGNRWTVQVVMTNIADIDPNTALEIVAGINKINELIGREEFAKRRKENGE